MRSVLTLAIALLVASLVTGCLRPQGATLPSADDAYVAVLSGEMPGSYRDIARHSWIVAGTPAAIPYNPQEQTYNPRRQDAKRQWRRSASSSSAITPAVRVGRPCSRHHADEPVRGLHLRCGRR